MPVLVLIWVWTCAYLNCAGWALSALHQLNAGGYAVALRPDLKVLGLVTFDDPENFWMARPTNGARG